MAVLLFPGQGSQKVGMGKELLEAYPEAESILKQANEILGFDIANIMCEGSEEDLKKTSVTQPSVLINAYARYFFNKEKTTASCVAGHSLGEFTALIANNILSFESALKLVAVRASAMQKACEASKGTMAAILGLDNDIVEKICDEIEEVVVPANYNCPGQLVISGSIAGVEKAAEVAKEKGARRAILLPVDGAFHSPLMEPARVELAEAIESSMFNNPSVPIYQNSTGECETEPESIKANLIAQLTDSVKWTQIMTNMVAAGETDFIEFGAKVLSGFVRKVDRSLNVSQF